MMRWLLLINLEVLSILILGKKRCLKRLLAIQELLSKRELSKMQPEDSHLEEEHQELFEKVEGRLAAKLQENLPMLQAIVSMIQVDSNQRPSINVIHWRHPHFF